jgi:hypothetical protein
MVSHFALELRHVVFPNIDKDPTDLRIISFESSLLLRKEQESWLTGQGGEMGELKMLLGRAENTVSRSLDKELTLRRDLIEPHLAADRLVGRDVTDCITCMS